MSENRTVKRKSFLEWRLTLGVYGCILFALIFIFAFYRIKGHTSASAFLVSRPGVVSMLAIVLWGTFAIATAWSCLDASKRGMTSWRLILVTNVTVVLVVVLVLEVFLRVMVHKDKIGEQLGSMLLYPRQWERTTQAYQALMRRVESHPTYMVSDDTLGFTIGAARQSEDGPYFSSVEGLRSSRTGESFQGPSPGCRIALVGDSYTFGEVVPYEDTWGYRMQQRLGPQCQVLNFGVGGYGVDQMYLRYLKDVRAWHPDLVILGFINHDVIRTMGIYTLLMFPEGGMPFLKPRFVLKDDQLEILNQPLARISEMLNHKSIQELPFIEYDVNYKETEWDRPMDKYFDFSYAIRFLLSLYPLHERERPQISTPLTERINRKIFENFRNVVMADQAVPVIVYLPTDTDYSTARWDPVGLKILREADLTHYDLRECLGAAGDVAKLFNPREVGGHYSPFGNQAMSDCLFRKVPTLSRMLQSEAR